MKAKTRPSISSVVLAIFIFLIAPTLAQPVLDEQYTFRPDYAGPNYPNYLDNSYGEENIGTDNFAEDQLQPANAQIASFSTCNPPCIYLIEVFVNNEKIAGSYCSGGGLPTIEVKPGDAVRIKVGCNNAHINQDQTISLSLPPYISPGGTQSKKIAALSRAQAVSFKFTITDANDNAQAALIFLNSKRDSIVKFHSTGDKQCDPGYHLENGQCVQDVPQCDPGYHLENGQCVQDVPQCDPGYHLENGQCVPDQAPSDPTCEIAYVKNLIKKWANNEAELNEVIEAINHWASSECTASSGLSPVAMEQQKTQLMAMLQNPSNQVSQDPGQYNQEQYGQIPPGQESSNQGLSNDPGQYGQGPYDQVSFPY